MRPALQTENARVSVSTTSRYLLLSTVSGLLWGLVGVAIGRSVFHDTVWGGLIASPLIGLIAGLAARPLIHAPIGGLAILALANLHLAAALFGLASGLYDWIIRHGRTFELVFQDIPIVLWGLTVSGWVFLLWPLAVANHRCLARWA